MGREGVEGGGGYWSSPEAQRMRLEVPKFGDKTASGYDILLDWMQPYKSVAHTMGVIGIRCADVPARDKCKDSNFKAGYLTPPSPATRPSSPRHPSPPPCLCPSPLEGDRYHPRARAAEELRSLPLGDSQIVQAHGSAGIEGPASGSSAPGSSAPGSCAPGSSAPGSCAIRCRYLEGSGGQARGFAAPQCLLDSRGCCCARCGGFFEVCIQACQRC